MLRPKRSSQAKVVGDLARKTLVVVAAPAPACETALRYPRKVVLEPAHRNTHLDL